MKYAIIRIAGKQYKVTPGQEILVDKLLAEKPEAEVLMVCDGDSVNVGTPLVEKAKLTLKVLNPNEKGEKVEVMKYKAKSRYRRKMGFRPSLSRIVVEKIA